MSPASARDSGDPHPFPATALGDPGIASFERCPPGCERLQRLSRESRATVPGVVKRREPEYDDRKIAELAALADDTLAPERRAALEARVAASPELADRLAEQQRAVALAQGAAREVEAPAALRARVEAQRNVRRAGPARRYLLAGAAAAAVVAVAVSLAVIDSGSQGTRFAVSLAPTELAPDARG